MLFFCIYLSLMEFLQQLTLGKWTFTFIYFNILKGGSGCGWDTHNRRYSRENRNIRVSKWQCTRQPYLKCLIWLELALIYQNYTFFFLYFSCIRTRGMATIYVLLKIRYFGQLRKNFKMSISWMDILKFFGKKSNKKLKKKI